MPPKHPSEYKTLQATIHPGYFYLIKKSYNFKGQLEALERCCSQLIAFGFTPWHLCFMGVRDLEPAFYDTLSRCLPNLRKAGVSANDVMNTWPLDRFTHLEREEFSPRSESAQELILRIRALIKDKKSLLKRYEGTTRHFPDEASAKLIKISDTPAKRSRSSLPTKTRAAKKQRTDANSNRASQKHGANQYLLMPDSACNVVPDAAGHWSPVPPPEEDEFFQKFRSGLAFI